MFLLSFHDSTKTVMFMLYLPTEMIQSHKASKIQLKLDSC